MKRFALAAFACTAGLALAQAPAAPAAPDVQPDTPPPKWKCEPKPDYPGRLAMGVDSKRKVFERDMKNYQDCMKLYLDVRKATLKANEKMASDAVDEYNGIMKGIQDAQKQ